VVDALQSLTHTVRSILAEFTSVKPALIYPYGAGAGGLGTQNTASHGTGASGGHVKDSSNTKGAEYDQTGGQVDDRTTMQKMKDKFTKGDDVGKHTKA